LEFTIYIAIEIIQFLIFAKENLKKLFEKTNLFYKILE